VRAFIAGGVHASNRDSSRAADVGCQAPPRAVSIPRTFSDYVGAMGEVSAEYRRKAEACRRLADLSPETERKAYWIEQAAEWERRAAKAAKRERSIPAK
jgi:hypothetical protein